MKTVRAGVTTGAVLVAALSLASAVGAAPALARDGASVALVTKRPVALQLKLAAPLVVYAGSKVSLSLSKTVLPARDKIIDYRVSYGDGTRGTLGHVPPRTLTHVWLRPGTYTITATVLDARHQGSKATKRIIVRTHGTTPAPVAPAPVAPAPVVPAPVVPAPVAPAPVAPAPVAPAPVVPAPVAPAPVAPAPTAAPPTTAAPTTVTGVSGNATSCAILSDKTVECWGDNSNGQLGIGSTTAESTPTKVPGLSGVVGISAGSGNQTCAVLSGGTADCWGENNLGQLGDGTQTDRYSPTAVPGLSGVTGVSVGSYTTCAVTSAGTVYCWGDNSQGESGVGGAQSGSKELSPTQVPGISTATQVSEGGEFGCALLSGGTVDCWGDDNYGQLGNGDTRGYTQQTPVAVVGLANATAIAGGEEHACAATSAGTLDCWGRDAEGELGDGSSTDAHTTGVSYSPIAVPGLSGVTAVSAGEDNTCVTLSGGTADCWGDNSDGQLGDGTTTEADSPRQVPGLTGVSQVAAGNYNTLAVFTNGTVDSWGSNQYGQLGDGTTTNHPKPAQITVD